MQIEIVERKANQVGITDWGQQGEAYRMQCNYSRAITCFDKAIEEQPGSAWAYAHRGAAKGALADLEGALSDFDKAMELKGGKYPWVLAQKGEAYRIYTRDNLVDLSLPDILGYIDKALKAFDGALGEMPTSAWAYAHRGAAHTLMVWIMAAEQSTTMAESEHARKADADYRRALELSPQYCWALIFHALLLVLTDNYQQARKCLMRAISLDPNREAFVSKIASMVASYCGAYDDTIDFASHAFQSYPDEPLVRYWNAVGAAKRGDSCANAILDNARSALKVATSLTVAALGGLDALEGNFEGAKQALRKLREHPDAETLAVMARDPAWNSLRNSWEYKELFRSANWNLLKK